MVAVSSLVSRVSTEKSRRVLHRLGEGYAEGVNRLYNAAAHADKRHAHGMAQDLRRSGHKLLESSYDMTVISGQKDLPARDELVRQVAASRRQARPALDVAQLVAVPAGPVPGTAGDTVMNVRKRWFAPLHQLVELRRTLQINPAKPGESLNTWINAIKDRIGGAFELAGEFSKGQVSAPEAIQSLKAMRRDPDFRAAIARGRALAGS